MAAHTVNVTAATFQAEVIEASKTVPVVVDFWAPWCGPCRVLTPILEKLAAEYGGRFKLAKLNSDENQEVAAAFGVQSIPDVMGFRDGRPVAHFLGVVPESQARAFIDRLVPSPSELEQARAADLRAAGDVSGAEAALRNALKMDPLDDLARLDLAALLIEAGRLDEAEPLLDEVRPDVDLDARVATLRAAIAFAHSSRSGAGEGDLRARVATHPDDHEARLALAGTYAGEQRYREALDQLLEIVRRDKDWNDGEARKQILAIFNLAERDADLVSDYRRKLATTLY